MLDLNKLSPGARLLIFLAITVLLLCLPYVLPQSFTPLTAGIEFLDEASDLQTLEQVRGAPSAHWRPVAQGANPDLFLNPTNRWLRLTIPPSAAGAGAALVAEVVYPYLDQVDFYVGRSGTPEDSAAVAETHQGMSQPDFGFQLGTFYPCYFSHSAERGDRVLIHMQGSGLMVTPLLVLGGSEYHTLILVRILLFGIFAGFALALFLFMLRSALLLREPVFAYAALVVLFATLATFEFDRVPALSRLFSGPSTRFPWSSRFTLGFFCMFGFFFATVGNHLLALGPIQPFYRRLMRGGQLLFAVAALGSAILPLYYAVALSSVIGIGGIGLCLVLGARLVHIDSIFLPMFGVTAFCVCYLSSLAQFYVPDFLLWKGVEYPYPLHLGILILGVAFGAGILYRVRDLQEEKRQVTDALRLSPTHPSLNALLDRKYQKQAGSGNIELTVMFIDIVGFSILAEREDPRQVFGQLTEQLAAITEIVTGYDGMVDRSLGDGLLCFFGYGASKLWPNHALACFEAAKHIQRTIVERSVASGFKKLPLPVRIGINTAEVTVGNLGGRQRIDFTIIGRGVNFASRLEAACAPFKMIVSEATLERLDKMTAETPGFSPIHIAVKHQANLVLAYEYDPFVDSPEALQATQQNYWNALGVERLAPRHAIADQDVWLKGELANFRVENVSANGFGAISAEFIGRNVVLDLELVLPDSGLNQELRDKLLNRLAVEVRWSRRTANGYRHGLKLVGLNERQRLYLLDLLQSLQMPASPETIKRAG